MQPPQRGVGMALLEGVERLPQHEKIKPGAEAALRRDKEIARMTREAIGQIVAAEKHVARLFQTVVIGKIDVVKGSGNRCTLFIPA